MPKPFTKGADPRRGSGKKGRSGRKPDAWRAELQAMVSSDAVLDKLEMVLRDPNHPAYVGALKYASDHGFGRAKETVEHTGEIKHGVVILPSITGK